MTEMKETAFLMQNVSSRICILQKKVVHSMAFIDPQFNLRDGPRHVPYYGLLLAQGAGLPSSVVETAKRITEKMTEKEFRRIQVNCMHYESIRMAYHVAQRLICLRYSNQDEEAIRQALQNLKESYLEGRLTGQVPTVAPGNTTSSHSSGDGSGDNLVVKRAQVGVIPRWVTEWEVLSATPLRSIEARGNGERRPVGVGPVGLPLCRNKSVRVGWADVGGAEAWASYQSIGTQSGQYFSSDSEWWGLTIKE
ncbi:hypothetical protein ACLOJK_005613 [Asimina triloba]